MKAVAGGLGSHGVLLGVIVAVAAVSTFRASVFLTYDNLIEIFLSTSTYFVMACPAALLIIAGGLDFGIGATFSVGAAVACGLMTTGLWWPACIVIGLAAGAGAGGIGGFIAVQLRVTPIIATLAVYLVATGLVEVFVQNLIAPLPEGFLSIGQGDFIGVPKLVWYSAVVGLVFWVVLERTPFGYDVRAVGGNRNAAINNGIRARRISLTLYAMTGGFAALAGILYSARTSAGQPDAGGFSVTLQVLTAVLVGGVSLSGGLGSIGGVLLGSLLFGELQNALGVANFNQTLSNVFIGLVLVLSVVLDGYRRSRRFDQTNDSARGSSLSSVTRLELPRVLSEHDRDSSARVVAAVDTERKRFERDLHDGAQQQLVNAALILRTARRQLERSPDEHVRTLLDSTSETLLTALGELRDLSRGTYPSVLTDRGLLPAVRALAERTVLPVEIEASITERLPENVEVAAYFIIAEALTNALKHANATVIEIFIDLAGPSALALRVVDDGVGFDPAGSPSGLSGLRDRIKAVDGSLSVTSEPGAGAAIVVTIPLAVPVGAGQHPLSEIDSPA